MNTIRGIACLLLSIAVAAGAMGAHYLKHRLETSSIESFKTGVLYLLLHMIAVLCLSAIPSANRKTLMLFIIGSCLFSLSIFVLSTDSMHQLYVKWLGPITPIGGLMLIGAWIWQAAQFFVSKK